MLHPPAGIEIANNCDIIKEEVQSPIVVAVAAGLADASAVLTPSSELLTLILHKELGKC